MLLLLLGAGATTARASYGFDGDRLGVRTSVSLSGGLTNCWSAASGSPDGFGRILEESLGQSGLTLRASGLALGAGSVSGSLDGVALSAIDYSASNPDGRWSADLTLAPGSHTLSMSAQHPSGRFSSSDSSTFTVAGSGGITNTYDDGGWLSGRALSGGTQTLTWDGAGRLVAVSLRDGLTNGYDWSAIYDGLGRRLRTVRTSVAVGLASTNSSVEDSLYDPQVEFLELAVALNGVRSWKVYGPDLNGVYGGAQGLGGLESTVREGDGRNTAVVQDYFGNLPAELDAQQRALKWSGVRLSGYGPLLGYGAPHLSGSVGVAEASVWRGKRQDPSGFYWLGARYYDSVGGAS